MSEPFLIRDEKTGRVFRVTPPCVIGRGEGVDLDLHEPTVSHRHARVFEEEGRVWVEDLKSRNGVYVNGKRVEGKSAVAPGDSIRLGEAVFLFCREGKGELSDTLIIGSSSQAAENEIDHKRLQWLYKMTVALSEQQEPAVLGARFFSNLKEIYGQDQGYLGLFREDGSLEAVFSDDSRPIVPVSKSIINRLLQNGESFILADALGEEALKAEESVLALKIRSALCVPLIYRRQIYGLIYLSKSVPGAYNREDLEFLKTIAGVMAPMVENARLWAEIKSRHASTVETLKETQSRLIEMERAAAYVWLAQAIAHEIRNPLVVIGGMVRRMAQADSGDAQKAGIQAVMASVERIESVLKEVDTFVKLPSPDKKLEKIDVILQEQIELHEKEWSAKGIHPVLKADTSHLVVPLDGDLFARALSLLFREIMLNAACSMDLPVTVRDRGNEIEIVIGRVEEGQHFADPSEASLQSKPWVLDLFLNMAQKLIADQGGRMLLEARSLSACPVIIRLQRIEKH